MMNMMNTGMFNEADGTTVNINQMTDFFRMMNNINKEENIYEDLGLDKGDITVFFHSIHPYQTIPIICSLMKKFQMSLKNIE